MIKTSTVFALTAITLGASFAVPAFAQDRTPPDTAIRDMTPTIDLRPGQVFMTQHDMARTYEGRSAARDIETSSQRDTGARVR